MAIVEQQIQLRIVSSGSQSLGSQKGFGKMECFAPPHGNLKRTLLFSQKASCNVFLSTPVS